MINTMQTAYVRILRKIKQKADGESAIAKDLAKENVEKLLSQFNEDPNIRRLHGINHDGFTTSNMLINKSVDWYKKMEINIASPKNDAKIFGCGKKP